MASVIMESSQETIILAFLNFDLVFYSILVVFWPAEVRRYEILVYDLSAVGIARSFRFNVSLQVNKVANNCDNSGGNLSRVYWHEHPSLLHGLLQ